MPAASTDRRLTRLLVVALLAAAVLRVVASVVSGLLSWASAKDLAPGGAERAGQVLSAFGSAGDTIEALLLVGAVVLIWRGFGSIGSAYRAWLQVLVVATVALVLCRVAGLFVFTEGFPIRSAAGQQAAAVGVAVADLVICFTVLAAVRLLASPEAGAEPDVDADDVVLFAVDRKTGEVFAFFSQADARRAISTYSVEDDEFAFYDDEGHVVTTDVVDGWIRFTPTDANARETLLGHLRRFAAARSLAVENLDEPLDYAQPISEWQWLELWPGWMRGVGRGLARLRRP